MQQVLPRLRRAAHLDDDPRSVVSAWRPPKEVAVDGSVLRFSPELDATRLVFPESGLLTKFLHLELAAARDVETFARHWGRLYLCAHGLPYTHELYRPMSRIPPNVFLPPVDERPPDWWPTDAYEVWQRPPHRWSASEPVEGWRYLAGRMAGTLEAAAVLDVGEEPSVSTWERAGGLELGLVVERFRLRDSATSRDLVLNLVNDLLALTAPEISVTPTGLAVGGSGLASALAMQLAIAIARQDTDLLPCMEPGCTNPASRPRRGAKSYCGYHLAHGVRRRDAQRRRRARQAVSQADASPSGHGQ